MKKPKKKRASLAVVTITELIADRQRLCNALRDLLAYYDKVTGVKSHGDGWTTADVRRMEEVRKLCQP